MVSFVLRVEAVNFAATLYDTSDLSTVRGSSLAMLRSDKAIEKALKACGLVSGVGRIFAGASQSAYRFQAADDGAAENAADAVRRALASPEYTPLDHMCFVVDWVPDTGGAALDHATARNHSRQFRQWTVALPRFEAAARGYDPLDRMCPAVTDVNLPSDRKKGRTKLSASVAARREYGVDQRQQFYEDELGLPPFKRDGGLAFAKSFEDIVRHHPPDVPLELQSKIAVLYADGNRFGAIRGRMAKAPSNATDAVATFSTELVPLQRKLLANMIDWYHRGVLADKKQLNRFGAFDRQGNTIVQYRLETLLWGGDEMMFVVPCWLALDLLEGFFQTTQGWKIGEERLTFAAGLVICHHKTPIRQAIRLAKELVDGCKDIMRSKKKQFDAASIAVFESLAPPDTGLVGYRSRLYGTRSQLDDALLAESLTLPGDKVGDLLAKISAYKWESKLPRSQVYRLLRTARRQQRGYFDPNAVAAIEGAAHTYAAGAGAEKGIDLSKLALPGVFAPPAKRPLPLELALLAEMWSYARPFKQPLPTFIEGEAR